MKIDRGEGKRGDSCGRKEQGEIPKRRSLKEAHRTHRESDPFTGALCCIRSFERKVGRPLHEVSLQAELLFERSFFHLKRNSFFSPGFPVS